jgi:hypothetical protein
LTDEQFPDLEIWKGLMKRGRNFEIDLYGWFIIKEITIQPSVEAKYLGVIFDQQLRFNAHLQQVVKKGTNAALAISNIPKCNWGTPYRYARQLFQAVVAPRMDYAAMIWHRPRADGSTGSSNQVQNVNSSTNRHESHLRML